MNTKTDLPSLWNSVGGSFHQDAVETGLQLDEIVDEDTKGWSVGLLDEHISEIQRALGYLDLDPHAFTTEDLGCNQDLTDGGYDVRSFLEMLAARMHERRRQLLQDVASSE